jgi:hypothetical protein
MHMELTSKKLIFISCGQETEDEKSLGKSGRDAMNTTQNFEAYFAEAVHDIKEAQ